MKTLDRYIIRNFMSSVGLWFFVLIALRIVADVFISVDEFTEGDASFIQVITDICSYYSFQILLYIKEMGGLAIVAAAAFALARMNHTNELTAMLASGVSLYRVIWPVVLGAMLLGGLIIIDQEIIIPNIAHKLVRERDDVRGQARVDIKVLIDGTGAAWNAPSFIPTAGQERMINPLLLVRDANKRLLAPIVGSEAMPTQLDGHDGWRINDAHLTRVSSPDKPWLQIPTTEFLSSSLSPAHLLSMASQNAGGDFVAVKNLRVHDPKYNIEITASQLTLESPETGGAVLVGPRFEFTTQTGQKLGTFVADTASWSDSSIGEGGWNLEGGWLFYPSDLTPEEISLRLSSAYLDFMSTTQLTSLLRLKRVRDPSKALLALHSRFTDPINNLVMLLLALPFIVSRERNIKVSAGMCLLVVTSFCTFIYICRYMSLPPDVAAWLPILAFGGVVAAQLHAIKT